MNFSTCLSLNQIIEIVASTSMHFHSESTSKKLTMLLLKRPMARCTERDEGTDLEQN